MHGNYLKASVRAAGLDPDALPESDPSAMDFSGSKAWKDIWGCGQGIDGVKDVVSTAALVDRYHAEFEDACARVAAYGVVYEEKA